MYPNTNSMKKSIEDSRDSSYFQQFPGSKYFDDDRVETENQTPDSKI